MHDLSTLAAWIIQAKSCVIFTGAGMSTESGIPDFRSAKHGLWQKFNPNELANVRAISQNRDEFVQFYQARLSEIQKFSPHQGHLILAKWQQQGLIKAVITQNVDGFHSQAGNTNVQELHGSFAATHCQNCTKHYSLEQFINSDAYCPCGGTIRPNIVLFGEMLPQTAFAQAEQLSLASDLFIVLGSSLTVSPANSFPQIAKIAGAKLVIINNDATDLDHSADLVINHVSIKNALIELDRLIKKGA